MDRYYYTIIIKKENGSKQQLNMICLKDDFDIVINELIDPQDTYKITEQTISCDGCRYNSPSQLDHNELGGCLENEIPYYEIVGLKNI